MLTAAQIHACMHFGCLDVVEGGGGEGVGSRGCVGRDGKKAESLGRDPPQ